MKILMHTPETFVVVKLSSSSSSSTNLVNIR